MTSVLVTNLVVITSAFVLLWLVSLALRDASIVDIFWGMGFVLVAWVTLWQLPHGPSIRHGLLVGLTTLWGVRLAAYLAWRNLGRGKGEDYRYQAMRARHGAAFKWVSLVTVFWLQATILWVVSLPVQAGQLASGPDAGVGVLDTVGVVFFAIGLFFEAVGDYQLARFKGEPANAGKVMDRGLWRYTRHPNYFGDFMVWWGIYLVAASAGAWWTAIGPALLSFLLLRVSGVTLLERSLKTRRPGYEDYIRRTSAFFPWPPR